MQSMAQSIADKCISSHYFFNDSRDYNNAHNIYASKKAINPYKAIKFWKSFKTDYNPKTSKCKSERLCNPYEKVRLLCVFK